MNHHWMIENLFVIDERLRYILKATSSTENMQQFMELIVDSFPEEAKILMGELRQFH